MKQVLIILTLLSTFSTLAQMDNQSELFHTLKEQDSTFFERGFNLCDVQYMDTVIAKDLKFYHDQSGVNNREQFFENSKKYLCSGRGPKPIRKLEEGSLTVFPLHNNGVLYGAIQHGIHHFYLREEGKEDVWTSSARFTHVWSIQDGIWKLSTVLSYDHSSEVGHLRKP